MFLQIQLLILAARDERIVTITAAMPEGTGLNKFAKKYPQRFIDVGIGEQNAVTMAAALALKGLHPVVAIYSTFCKEHMTKYYMMFVYKMLRLSLPLTEQV